METSIYLVGFLPEWEGLPHQDTEAPYVAFWRKLQVVHTFRCVPLYRPLPVTFRLKDKHRTQLGEQNMPNNSNKSHHRSLQTTLNRNGRSLGQDPYFQLSQPLFCSTFEFYSASFSNVQNFVHFQHISQGADSVLRLCILDLLIC